MVKQKKSMDGGSNDERADWKDLEELEAFCQFCVVQVMEGLRKSTRFLSKIGVNEVIRQLGEMGKVVTWLQIKNKWDHLKKRWKNYNQCLDNETGLGYDAGTRMFDAPDEWWNRKIAACPNAKTFKTHGLPNRELLNIMFGGTVATGKNALCTSGPIPTETTKGSADSADSIKFVDPQCEPIVNVDAMEVEGSSSLRVGPIVNKGKGLTTSVHIFKPICKKQKKKKRSAAQEMSDSLKNISNVIVERSSLSAHIPSAPTATAQDSYIVDTFPSASFEGNNGLCHAEYCTCQSKQTPIHSPREKKRIINGLPFEIGAATGFVLTVIYCFMSGLSFP
ncbi:uncharacterized protein At2g29880-like [Quercus lobata]|uniref:uncharacterized protein At2g29880-like n=1 Tax=Quercus lobata TaxID=97700 RepID=UPI0012489650|nr:uncharacterized protein At2g29880-like [Quercus lobata]